MDKRIQYKIIESPELLNQFKYVNTATYHMQQRVSEMQDRVLKMVLTEVLGREAIPEDGKRVKIGINDSYPEQWLIQFAGQLIGSLFTHYEFGSYECSFNPTIKSFTHPFKNM